MEPISVLPALAPRAVPAVSALAWYEQALRLFKRAPGRWCALGLLTILTELGLDLVPGIGSAAANVLTPVVACGMLIGARALDRGDPLQVGHALAAFRAPPMALAAIIASAFVSLAAEALAAYTLAGVNLFVTSGAATELAPIELLGVFALGILASLPVTFVPFAVLFDRASFGGAFASSFRAFALNVLPLCAYGGLALVLLGLGLITFGVGLVVVIPLWATASYAAWMDIYSIRDAPAPR